MDHISLQFDGAEIAMRPFPPDFKGSAELFIAKKTGFKVNLVEKSHHFLLDLVIREAITSGRIACPDAKSPLFEKGNGILLAMFLLEGDEDLCGTYEDVARNRRLNGATVRSYMDCLSYVGGCSLALVSEADMKIGGKYIIHADGRADEPYCLPMRVSADEMVEVSSGSAKYYHNMAEMREIISRSIDKPTLF